ATSRAASNAGDMGVRRPTCAETSTAIRCTASRAGGVMFTETNLLATFCVLLIVCVILPHTSAIEHITLVCVKNTCAQGGNTCGQNVSASPTHHGHDTNRDRERSTVARYESGPGKPERRGH